VERVPGAGVLGVSLYHAGKLVELVHNPPDVDALVAALTPQLAEKTAGGRRIMKRPEASYSLSKQRGLRVGERVTRRRVRAAGCYPGGRGRPR
jgi:hypothetical protein